MAEEADWSQLPAELLDLVSQHLTADTDRLRFRSVCAAWRAAVSPPPPPSRSRRFPILPTEGIPVTTWGFNLSKRTVYYLQSPEYGTSWIIKLESDVPGRGHLLNPLTGDDFNPLPANFPRNFSFLNLRIKELGQEYALQYNKSNSIGEAWNLYMEKVAVCLNSDGVDKDDFVLLTIHVSGKLVVYKSGDKKWTVINYLPSPYDDVICRNGQFYAVDGTGRTVIVNVHSGSVPSVSLVADSVFGGDKKFLVESRGELLLVDMYLSAGPEDDLGYSEDFEFYEEFDCFMSERTVKFKVFSLDVNAEKWVEVSSLGDRMLFLGDNCTFSASASEIFGGDERKGNCIFFTDQFSREDDGLWKSREQISGIGVFDLDSGSIGPIVKYDGYCKMFWPPPDWVYSAASVEAQFNQLMI